MAHPSSAADTNVSANLLAYHQRGGNALHLHGEGGETHSRIAAGEWLATHECRELFFICTQVCHDDWDETAQLPIDRFTPEAFQQDIATDMALIGTRYLDMVYLDDRPNLPYEPIVQAIGLEIAAGRLRSFGVRNFTAPRLHAIHSYARSTIGQGVGAVITTELSMLKANRPLWPEYVAFDASLRQAVTDLGLSVFAHAGDLTLGQCLFGDAEPLARLRPEWVERWQHPDNAVTVEKIKALAAASGRTTRELQTEWLLNQPFPVVGIVGV